MKTRRRKRTLIVTGTIIASTLMLGASTYAATTARIIGTVTAVKGSSFSIVINRPGARADQFEVVTGDSTVYMKDGKLDSLTDLSEGAQVLVSGTVDVSDKVIEARGVDMVRPSTPSK